MPPVSFSSFNGREDPSPTKCNKKIDLYMKGTEIAKRIDDLGRVVIPKEIRRTMEIIEGDPS